MDPSSIITQVSRDGENYHDNVEALPVPVARVSKPRSLLRSLLCCFGRRPLNNNNNNNNNNNGAAGRCSAVCGSAGAAGRGDARLLPSPSSPPLPVSSVAGTATSSPHNAASVGNASGPAAAAVGGYLLRPVLHQDMGRVCVVIDLDETLVHSSFKPITNADFIVPVDIDGTIHQVYVLKRPHVDAFLQRMGQLFECVLFTASLAKYADPVADLLDKWGVFRTRLFRDSCVYYRGNYVKDLERLGRDVRRVVIVDNSPASYIFHPDNAVAVRSWFDDMSDTELLERLPLLERLSRADNVYTVLTDAPLSSQQQQQQQQRVSRGVMATS